MQIRTSYAVLIGDALALAVVTLIGFASHGEGISWRMASTYFPLLAAWGLAGGALGLLRASKQPPSLVRMLWAAILMAPLAAWLRALWLWTPVLPIFVLVLGSTATLALILWRYAYWLFQRRRS